MRWISLEPTAPRAYRLPLRAAPAPTMRRSPLTHTPRRLPRPWFALCLAAAVPAGAAEMPPHLVAKFTRHVQPLLMNKCAAGACHGGTASPALQLRRGYGNANLDRTTTLANLAAFLAAVGPNRDPQRLVATLSVKHPISAGRNGLAAASLSAQERTTLEGWLAAVRAADRPGMFDPAVTPAAALVAEPTAPKPNRFRDLLDASANPPQLPPPQAPQGIIFKPDAGE
jgi:hypothetical protein